jgi:hypothetical protein
MVDPSSSKEIQRSPGSNANRDSRARQTKGEMIMFTYAKKIAFSGALVALTVVAACTEVNPRDQLAYCQEYSTWNTGVPSAAGNCAVPSIASRDVGYDLSTISQ